MKKLMSEIILKRKIWKVKKAYVTIIATLFDTMLTSPTFNHVVGLHQLAANNFMNYRRVGFVVSSLYNLRLVLSCIVWGHGLNFFDLCSKVYNL